MIPATALKRTPLNSVHRRSGARMVDFGGWDMPVQYTSLVEEHHAVRQRAGLFDVSHMGEIEIRGVEAFQLVDHVTPNSIADMKPGQAKYSALLYAHGCFVDDILVYKLSHEHFFLCVNASNQDKDYQHILAANRWNAEVDFASNRYAQLAIPGPKAEATLQKLTPATLASIRYYHFLDSEVAGTPARIARTGYTGEDVFEIFIPPDEAPRMWDAVLEAGAEFGIRPCGLGARNTLRLEAAMALYGHEIHATIDPFEAGLGRMVRFDKGDFIGRDALQARQQRGLQRKLIGFEMRGRGIGRDGYEVLSEGRPAGWVTSGSPSPTLGRNIGLCYLPAAEAEVGRTIEVVVRGQPVEAVTVATPFYKRAR